jgi:ribosomal protein S19
MKNLPRTTSSRNTIITKKLLRRRNVLRIYGGSAKNTHIVSLSGDMKYHKIGEFSFTKKLGKTIHDSARNKKRKKKQ